MSWISDDTRGGVSVNHTNSLQTSNETETTAPGKAKKKSKTELIEVPFKESTEIALTLKRNKDRYFCQDCPDSKFASNEGLAEGSIPLHARLKHSLKLTWNKKKRYAVRLDSWREFPKCPHCSKEYRRAMSDLDPAYNKHVTKCAQRRKKKEEAEEDAKGPKFHDHNYSDLANLDTLLENFGAQEIIDDDNLL